MTYSPLDQLLAQALTNYKQRVVSIKFFAQETDTIYQLKDEQGLTYALKIFTDTGLNHHDNEIEVLMLNALQTSTEIAVPVPIKNKQGKFLTQYFDEEHHKNYRLVLSSWLEGEAFEEKETVTRFVQLGKVLGTLHRSLQGLALPAFLVPKKWDRIFYFRAEKVVYQEEKYRPVLGETLVTLLPQIVPLLETRLHAIYHSAPVQLLHGDLNPWNIKVQANKFGLLDFGDAILGHPLHDLAIFLYYYRDHEDFSYQEVKEKLLQGYLQTNPIVIPKEEDLQVLMIARKVNFINYVLSLEGDYTDFLRESVEVLEQFLAKKIL